jgi:tetratricopeptide (TPR) repeat protein
MTAGGDPAARATALVEMGRSAEALPLIYRFIAQDPQNGRHQCLLSLALLKSGDPQGAENAAREGIRLDPEMEWPYRLRALALNGLGRSEEAVVSARRGIELAPQLPAAHVALVEAARGAKRPNLARQAATELIRLAPEWATSHYLLGKIDLDARCDTDAANHFREALRLDPQMRIAHNDLGVASLRLGDRSQASLSFQAAAELDPADQTATNNLRLMARQNRLPMPRWSRYHVFLIGPGLVVAVVRKLTRRHDFRGMPSAARREVRRQSPREMARLGLVVLAGIIGLVAIAAQFIRGPGPFGLPSFGDATLVLVLLAILCMGVVRIIR